MHRLQTGNQGWCPDEREGRQSKAYIVGDSGEWAKRSPPRFLSFMSLSDPLTTTPSMLHFKVNYQDVFCKPIASDVLHVNDIEEAINVVVDYCLSHRTTWGAEISNARGTYVYSKG